MTTLTRRRSSREDEPEDERDARPTRRTRRSPTEDDEPRRGRRSNEDEPHEERNSSPRRGRRSRDEDEDREARPRRGSAARDADEGEDRPTRSRRGSSRDAEASGDEDDRPRRGRRARGGDSEAGGRRSRGTGGFSSYAQKKRASSNFADEFKPEPNTPTLIKFLEDGPFDVYNQHWVTEGDAAGKTRHSFVCRDDEYFPDDDGCPLDDIGDNPSTQSLFNILDLTNPRKPEVKVWKTSPVVTDKLERAASDTKTKPLNREDLYWEVRKVQKKNKTEWDILPVKARDLLDDFDVDPFSEDELADFEDELFTDRTAITKVDSYDELAELADSLDY